MVIVLIGGGIQELQHYHYMSKIIGSIVFHVLHLYFICNCLWSLASYINEMVVTA